jgi:5-formyltetrahydrofolate cyclo-ligase
MSKTLAEQKAQLRQICRNQRKALGPEARAIASQAICVQIENWGIFQQAEVILTYLPMKAEVDLRPLLAAHPEKTWAVPRILEASHGMVFHPYDPARLVRHPFGMDEPAADLPVIPDSTLQLCLVPGLAYDRQGWRLGYGGGYYDRFLQHFPGPSLGVTFAALLLESLPHGEWDVPMRGIVTENGLVEIT